jgi:hypothetical protein
MAESAAGPVIGGAVTGGAAGASFGPYGVIIGAAIGAIGGFFSSRGESDAADEMRRRQAQAMRLLSTKAILRKATRVTPQFRALVAGGIGPGIESRVASNLARTGFADTGAGEALRGLSYQVPGAIASQGALQFAKETNFAAASALLGAPAIPPSPNAILSTLSGGLQGGLGTFLALQKAQTAQQGQIATLQGKYPDLIPGNAPTAPPRDPYFPAPSGPKPPIDFIPRGPLF